MPRISPPSLAKTRSPAGLLVERAPVSLTVFFRKLGSNLYGQDWRDACISSLGDSDAVLALREMAETVEWQIRAALAEQVVHLGAYFSAGRYLQMTKTKQKKSGEPLLGPGSADNDDDDEDEDEEEEEGEDPEEERQKMFQIADRHFLVDPELWGEPVLQDLSVGSTPQPIFDIAESTISGLKLDSLIAGYNTFNGVIVTGTPEWFKARDRLLRWPVTLADFSPLLPNVSTSLPAVIYGGVGALRRTVKLNAVPDPNFDRYARFRKYCWPEIAAACWRLIALSGLEPHEMRACDLVDGVGKYLDSRGLLENGDDAQEGDQRPSKSMIDQYVYAIHRQWVASDLQSCVIPTRSKKKS